MRPACDAAWIERQSGIAASALMRCISASDLVCSRRCFGQTIVPAAGSVLAARQVAFYDPDPDYFFHWLRDSALVLDAVRLLAGDRVTGEEAIAKFGDFVRFSLRLGELQGRDLLREAFRRRVEPPCLQYLRSDDELREIEGERTLGEVRCNPDGTLDIIRWHRPQNDGPALRALTVLRWWRTGLVRNPELQALMAALVTGDLAYTALHRSTPCFDTWEEELCHPYSTRLVQRAALLEGAEWARALGDADGARRYRQAADDLAATLDCYWSAERNHYLSRIGAAGGDPDKALDSASLLAVLHAELPSGPHSVLDPGVHATWHQLEALFASGYAINRDLPPGFGPAFGRFKGDVYYDGGAWYVTTLAFAELYYRLAELVCRGSAPMVTAENRDFLAAAGCEAPTGVALDASQRRRLRLGLTKKGDAIMATVQRFTPASGEMSEQFDQNTGEQRSAKHLSWSYAAFVTASSARRRAHDAASEGAGT